MPSSDKRSCSRWDKTLLDLKMLTHTKRRPPSTDLPTLLLMEISGASSMVPDLPWLPWILLSSTEKSPPTSLMSVVVPLLTSVKLPSRSSLNTPMSSVSSSISSEESWAARPSLKEFNKLLNKSSWMFLWSSDWLEMPPMREESPFLSSPRKRDTTSRLLEIWLRELSWLLRSSRREDEEHPQYKLSDEKGTEWGEKKKKLRDNNPLWSFSLFFGVQKQVTSKEKLANIILWKLFFLIIFRYSYCSFFILLRDK